MKPKKHIEKETEKNNVSRRNFLKISGVTAVSVSVGGCASYKSKQKKGSQQIRKPKISRKRFEGRDVYDVVVVGTGMGGSAAGAIAAHHGLKTLILEKNPRPGGSCSYYEKQGFKIDTGAHSFIRANSGPFGDVTRRLGMGTPIEFARAQNTVTGRGINRDVTIPRNFFLRAMTFPSLVWQLNINPIHYMSIVNLLRKVMLIPEKEIERLDTVSVEEFVNRYSRDGKTAGVVSGLLGVMSIVAPWNGSAGEAVWNIQKLMRGMYVSYPRGGAVTIPETFLKGAENYGAEVRMNAGVRKIIAKEGKIDHVILDTGETVKTRAIISTTTAKDTVFRLVGETHFPESYVNQVKNIEPSLTAFQAKLGLKKKLVKSGILIGALPMKTEKDVMGEYIPKYCRDLYDGVRGKYMMLYAPVPTNYDPNLAPPGCQIVTAVAGAPHLEIEYKDPPEVWIENMMEALRAVIPGLDANLIFCDIWSVKATAEWVGKSSGAAITTAQTVGQTGKNRIGHKTPVQGLYLAGDCAGPARGVGTELACQSGMDCADLVARDFKEFLYSGNRGNQWIET